MNPRDLAVFLLATLNEYAAIAVSEINFEDAPEGYADLLDSMLRKADDLAVAALGEDGSELYTNGTRPVIEISNSKRFARWVRMPGDPVEPTAKQRAQLEWLEVVK